MNTLYILAQTRYAADDWIRNHREYSLQFKRVRILCEDRNARGITLYPDDRVQIIEAHIFTHESWAQWNKLTWEFNHGAVRRSMARLEKPKFEHVHMTLSGDLTGDAAYDLHTLMASYMLPVLDPSSAKVITSITS